MAAFFFISGCFCPASLDRKGFRDFVLSKILRLGGPFFLYSMALGPGLLALTMKYAGAPQIRYYVYLGPS